MKKGKIRWIFLALVLMLAAGSAEAGGLPILGFQKIAEGGFGDSANSYAWGMAWFKDDLYVGTNRHHLWTLLTAQMTGGGGLPPEFMSLLPVPPDGISWGDNPFTYWGKEHFAAQMMAEIWRYRNKQWTRVFQSPEYYTPAIPLVPGFTIPEGWYPVAYGYRTLYVFKDYIYAAGTGSYWPPLPYTSVIRLSADTRNESAGHEK